MIVYNLDKKRVNVIQKQRTLVTVNRTEEDDRTDRDAKTMVTIKT